jgi:4-amino-4-deoxy-L-arabinose transferase-like glycosyltransferase
MNQTSRFETSQRHLASTHDIELSRTWAVVIFAVALLVRLAILGLTFRGNENVRYYDDARIALNIVSGKGFSISYEFRNWLLYTTHLKKTTIPDLITEGTKPTASKQPVYPLILAALFHCFGAKNFLAVFLIQAVISSLTAVLLFLALKDVSSLTGLTAGLGTAFYPAFAWHCTTTPESTTITLFGLAAFFWCLTVLKKRPSLWVWAMIGVVGGIEALTEPVTAPFLAFCFCYAFFFVDGQIYKRCRGLLCAIGVAFLVTSPWLVRNYIVFNRFPLVKDDPGITFTYSMEASGLGTWIPEEKIVLLEHAGRTLSEVEEDEAIRGELRSLLPSHLREYLTIDIPMNFVHFWWDVWSYWDDYSLRYVLNRRLPYVLLLMLAIPSIWTLVDSLLKTPRVTLKGSVVPVGALVLICITCAVYTLFGCHLGRFRLPAEMALFVFAGLTLRMPAETLWNRWMLSKLDGQPCATG